MSPALSRQDSGVVSNSDIFAGTLEPSRIDKGCQIKEEASKQDEGEVEVGEIHDCE